MAITTTTVSIAGTWTRVNVLEQMGEALEWLGWHSIAGNGSSETGKVIGLQTYFGGGTGVNGETSGITNEEIYDDVFPVSTTGIGTGASFRVERYWKVGNSGATVISEIYANRPGYGYTGGEVVTLSAEDIGGSSNGATDMTIPVIIDADVTGGNSYIATYTWSSPELLVECWDRTGYVSGSCTDTFVTIQEGDTLKFDNNTGSFNFALCWQNTPNYYSDSSLLYEYTNKNRVPNRTFFNNANDPENTNSQFTPISGQAGKYYIREDNSDFRQETYPEGDVLVTAATSGISSVGVGTTNSYYLVDYTNTSYPWAMWRQSFDENKKFGATYRILGMNNSNSLMTHWAYSGFNPSDRWGGSEHSGSMGYPKRGAGAFGLDMYGSIQYTQNRFTTTLSDNTYSQQFFAANGGQTTTQLDLNVYRSGEDTDFAVFAYKAPYKSATEITDRNYDVWFYHNFSQNVWDLDECFTSGLTEIVRGGHESANPYLEFRMYGGGNRRLSGEDASKRSGEYGYHFVDNQNESSNYVACRYYSHIVPGRSSSSYSTSDDVHVYFRSTASGLTRKNGSYESNNKSVVGIDYNPVIKGIPVNANLVPCPYYLPDDFVLIDFFYSGSNQFIDQGDTITISGSEIYTIITASYYQSSGTTGIAFCARTT